MFDFQSKMDLLNLLPGQNLTSKLNFVNVLLVASACPIHFAPSSPILLCCEFPEFVGNNYLLFLLVYFLLVAILHSKAIFSMCYWLPILLQSLLLLRLRFCCSASV